MGDKALRSASMTTVIGRSGQPVSAAMAARSSASTARSLDPLVVKLTVVIGGDMAYATPYTLRAGPSSALGLRMRASLRANSKGQFPSNLRLRTMRTVRFGLSAHAVKIDRIPGKGSDALEAAPCADLMPCLGNCWVFSDICWITTTEQSGSALDGWNDRAPAEQRLRPVSQISSCFGPLAAPIALGRLDRRLDLRAACAARWQRSASPALVFAARRSPGSRRRAGAASRAAFESRATANSPIFRITCPRRAPPKASPTRIRLLRRLRSPTQNWISISTEETSNPRTSTSTCLPNAAPDFDIAVRDERTIVDMQHEVAATKKVAAHASHDEDVFCNLELRAHLTLKKIWIRRFSVSGVADLDPKSATRGSCSRTPSDTDPRHVSINVTDLVTDWTSGKAKVSGKVSARLPLAPVDRFVKFPPVQGWVSLNAQVKWDTTHTLPEMTGRLGGAGIQLERYQIADKLDTDFSIERDVLTIKRTELAFAEGRTIVHDTTIRPLEKDAPFTSRLVETHGMTFPGADARARCHRAHDSGLELRRRSSDGYQGATGAATYRGTSSDRYA